ncbi:IS1167 transposase [Streptococcus pneumoniae]|nr:IS1167 transposase [Streptococcus pneumoniae]
MKSDKTIIRKIHMEQLHFITKLLDIKDPNIQILDIINKDTHKEIIAKLDYDAPSCPFGCHPTTIHYALKAMGYTRKKEPHLL